jgi:DNA topoisomerase-2
MYVGPNERLPPQSFWVLDPPLALQEEPSSPDTTSFRFIKKEIAIVPALVKIFDEILVNASDNRLRHPKSCSRIDVIIQPGSDTEDPFISIYNDGKGIPIQIHKKENMYLPEMLFGHLLTGSNFNDDEKRITGGRHGYGAKLTNIFAQRFTVETADTKRGLCYRQTWWENMTRASEPTIKELKDDKDFTRISFVPDLPRLTGDKHAKSISVEDYSLMCRRVVDVAGCAADKLTVTLNGKNVSMPSFAHFVELHRKPSSSPLVHHNMNPRWKVSVGLSDTGSFESVSFVNGMATHRGGTHINALVQQISKKIQEKVEKLDPQLAKLISHGLIRRHLFVACDALIENPTFDSQMKEYLTSSPTNFGSSYSLTQKLLNDLVKPEDQGGPGIVEDVLRVASGRQQANLVKELTSKKSKRQLLSIPKLEEAHQAGSESGWDCTLILTEGDSAKALAVAGLEIIGRERFGVFPLRGKFLNVIDASVTQLTNNAEVKALCSILGLNFDKKYDTLEERRELRYGRVMLMTDQDQGKLIVAHFDWN